MKPLAFWARRFLRVAGMATMIILGARLLRGFALDQVLTGSFLWGLVASAVFNGTCYYYVVKGAACSRGWRMGLAFLGALVLTLSSMLAHGRDMATADHQAGIESGMAQPVRSHDRSVMPSLGSPALFAPELAWPAGSYASPAFTPDGQTVFFTHSVGAARTIVMSRRRNGAWSIPVAASFSGTWRDIEPAMAPDGSYLVFISNRPPAAGGEPLTGYWAGRARPGAGGNIWRVNREGDHWGEPVRLPAIVNSNSAIYSPAVARDGSIYFNQPDPVTRKSHIYRAQATTDGFKAPKPLSISDGTIGDFDAAVAPDESFLIFSSGRAPAKEQQALLFVSFPENGAWTTPRALEPSVDGLEARLSPDLKTLYFSAEVPQSATSKDTMSTTTSRIFELAMCGWRSGPPCKPSRAKK